MPMTFEEWFAKEYPLYRGDRDTTHKHVMKRAWDAARATPPEALIPEGWKLVPIEATHEMVKAYKNAMREHIAGAKEAGKTSRWRADKRGFVLPEREKCYARWTAMLAAAPAWRSPQRLPSEE